MYTKDQIDAYMAHLATKGYKKADIEAYRSHLLNNFGPDAPGGSPEKAVPGEIFTNTERLKAGFGNDQGVAEMLKAKGYKNVGKTKGGETLVQDANGKWIYEPTNFFPSDLRHPIDSSHPVNFAERNAAEALPVAGMVGGGMAGGIPGAGAGAFVGARLKNQLGGVMGTYKNTQAGAYEDAAVEGAKGAMAEVGGQALNQIPLKKYLPKYFMDENLGQAIQTGADYYLEKAKQALARLTWAGTLGKVPTDAAVRMMERPKEVMGMSETNRPGEPSDVVQGIADKAKEELEARHEALGQMVGKANQQFMQKNGSKMADTRPVIRRSEDFFNTMPVNELGTGRMSAWEENNLRDTLYPELYTKETTTSPVGGGMFSKPIQAPDQQIPYTPIEQVPDFAQGVRVVPGPTAYQTVPGPVVGYSTDLPKKSFENLKPFLDSLSEEAKGYWEKNPFAKSAPPDINYKEVLYGAGKDLMHQVDPNLAAADSAYSQNVKDMRLLKSLGTPGRGEGFISNLMGKNKTEAQRAAERAIPDTYNNEIADLQAARDFSAKAKGTWGHLVPVLRAGLGIGGAYGAHSAGSSPVDALLLGAAITGATDPFTAKYGLHYGSRAVSPMVDTLAPELGGRPSAFFTRTLMPWDIYNQENQR